MIRVWDGFLSLLAAIATLCIIGIPTWGAALAIRDGLMSLWAWAPLLLLAAAGAVMALSFLRKAGCGVHPLRKKRRS
ncbi:MAG: hypothetical protein HKO14_03180 [Silicimonas sp.]|nr:hypothetical protein [Silicimonas sp.]NND42294.1 hypothetical protein [Silicimonas sp.]